MYAESLSLFTAFCYGLNQVLIRKGIKHSNPVTATLIVSLMQVLVMSGMLLALPPSKLIWTGIALFVASGILASTLGRLCNYMSIERLGVSVTASVVGSDPLFSMLFAALLIGEKLTASILMGTVLVVIGVVLTSGGNGSGSFRRSAIVLPILAAAFYGASHAVRKIGLAILPEPILGALVGAAATLAFFSATCISTSLQQTRVKLHKGCIGYFTVSGFIISLGWASMFTATMMGKVSIVATLIGTYPLFSLLLSLILLRSSEKISRSVVAGCFIIVTGASIISLTPF